MTEPRERMHYWWAREQLEAAGWGNGDPLRRACAGVVVWNEGRPAVLEWLGSTLGAWLPEKPPAEELKPCPFCGGSAEVAGGVGVMRFVRCRGCRAEGPLASTEAETIARWNRRAGD